MNKAAMIAKIAEKTDLTKKQAEAALNAFTDSVIEALKEGDKVQMMGFGTFEVKERAARTGRLAVFDRFGKRGFFARDDELTWAVVVCANNYLIFNAGTNLFHLLIRQG